MRILALNTEERLLNFVRRNAMTLPKVLNTRFIPLQVDPPQVVTAPL